VSLEEAVKNERFEDTKQVGMFDDAEDAPMDDLEEQEEAVT